MEICPFFYSIISFLCHIILMDHYSRLTWFYPLIQKSEFYVVFLLFQKMVENQFQYKVAMCQCYGCDKFIDIKLVTHLSDFGTKQLVYCPHILQLKGLAEMQHRHTTELGLSMMLQGKVPHQLWFEAFFTSTYIGNLLFSSSVLPDNKNPFQLITGRTVNHTSLLVSGCECHSHICPYSRNA